MKLRVTTIAALAAALLAAPVSVLAEKGGKHGGSKEYGPSNEDRYEQYGLDDRGGKGQDKGKSHKEKGGNDRGGNDKGGKAKAPQDGYSGSGRASVEIRFGEPDRRAVYDYYGAQARRGQCPPGLAKKNNGCLPPGQAKKWSMGRPLPHDVRYYDLPHDLLVRMPPPPAGHRYVQVAGDILLIAVGTSMVVDAIQDIMR
ncbi:RcnB family protein [Propionivibrio limicola]|uniref:RcnB family protein n=1 Tax=Propionivibrio limicola TaxID=167645 RepID=UPI0012917A1A|nr:RcnB family protein [Propionivibrio limicola]